jgi:hypothetical protein
MGVEYIDQSRKRQAAKLKIIDDVKVKCIDKNFVTRDSVNIEKIKLKSAKAAAKKEMVPLTIMSANVNGLRGKLNDVILK